MRLVVFGPGHPFRGGVARTTTELVRSLQARGHEMHFLTPRRQYPGWLYPGRSDLDRDACARLDCAEAALDPLNPLSWFGSRRRALALDGDAWVFPYWTWAWAGLWRFLLRGERPPTVAVVHNPADHDAGFHQRLAARLVLGRCRGLFTHARALEKRLTAVYPGVPIASHPLPSPDLGALPLADEARAALRVPTDCRVALFLGLIRPYKGVDLLLEAIARQPAGSNWFLVVAGEPWGNLGNPRARLGAGARGAPSAGRGRPRGPALPLGLAIGGGAARPRGGSTGAEHGGRRSAGGGTARGRRLVGSPGIGGGIDASFRGA